MVPGQRNSRAANRIPFSAPMSGDGGQFSRRSGLPVKQWEANKKTGNPARSQHGSAFGVRPTRLGSRPTTLATASRTVRPVAAEEDVMPSRLDAQTGKLARGKKQQS